MSSDSVRKYAWARELPRAELRLTRWDVGDAWRFRFLLRRSLQNAPGFAELLSHSPLRPHQMSFRGLPGRKRWVPFDAVALEETIQHEIALSLEFRDKARRTWVIHYGEETHIEFTATSDEPVEAFVNTWLVLCDFLAERLELAHGYVHTLSELRLARESSIACVAGLVSWRL